MLYNGPMTSDAGANKDFLSVYIEGGFLTVDLDLGGGGPKILRLNNRNAQKVNDGEWHVVDIFAAPQQVEKGFCFCLFRFLNYFHFF